MRCLSKIHKVQILAVILPIVISFSLVGCTTAQAPTQAELQSRISNLEEKLSTAETTIEVLQQRIEKLEKSPQGSLTEADILRTLQGKTYWANVGGQAMQVQFWECKSLKQ